MSQNQKIGLIVVSFALVLSLGIAFYINSQKNQLAQAKANVESRLERSMADGVRKDQDIQGLNEKIEAVNVEKVKVEQMLKEVRQNVDDLSVKFKKLGDEKSDWEKRAGDIKAERDSLTTRISELNKQIENYKADEEARAKEEEEQSAPAKTAKSKMSTSVDDAIVSSSDEQWAGVLKDKAGLQVELDNLKTELSKASQDLIDVRQKNDELQISIDSLTEQKASVDREIKYKTDLVNSLSLDLARAKNDQRLKEQRIKELDNENQELRKRIKDLVSANGSLEKSMVRLNQDKRTVEKKLDTTEDLIHSKINEIWDIKNNIDQTMKDNRGNHSGDVELPPIMVNNQPGGSAQATENVVGINGKIASINLDNNFVIMSVGQKDGLKVGDSLSVYRGSQYIGRVNVIQVRDDIAAADIQEQSTPIQAGDIVK